jgi:hypothetical protein
MSIRVLIADDQPIARQGMRMILDSAELGLASRVQAVIFAYETGIVAPGRTDQHRAVPAPCGSTPGAQPLTPPADRPST